MPVTGYSRMVNERVKCGPETLPCTCFIGKVHGKMVEAVGVEPTSEELAEAASTSVAYLFIVVSPTKARRLAGASSSASPEFDDFTRARWIASLLG